MTTVSDDFNRADNASSLGSDWTNRVDAMGISGNTAYSPTSYSWVVASNNTTMGTDDMEASITYGPASSGNDYAMVAIGASSSGEMVLADHASYDGNFHIYSSGDWLYNDLVDQTTDSGPGITAGDVLKLKRVGNVYTLYLNGSSVATWTDSGNVIPRDSSHRLTAIGIYDDGSGQRRIDSFSAADTATAAIPVSVALAGSGALSATAVKAAPVAVALTGSGTLSAAAVKRAAATATLTATGALAATAAATGPVPVSVALGSTGQLDADISPIFGGPPTGGGDNSRGWTVEPVPPAPVHGPAWSTTATLPARAVGSGWFALRENVIPFASIGQLDATVATNYPVVTAALGGAGTLTATRTVIRSIAAAFTGTGAMAGAISITRAGTVAFTATGTLGAVINDGLAAVIIGGVPAEDGLTATISGGTGFDGLSATIEVLAAGDTSRDAALSALGSLTPVIAPKTASSATLAGAGSLSTTVTPALTAALSGAGALSGTIAPIIGMAATLAASGTLTATGYPVFTSTASLTGSGVLAATVTPIYAVSAALSGSGALSATGYASFSSAAGLTGSGALSATGIESYTRSAAFTGAGTLSAPPLGKGCSAALSSSGTLSATVTSGNVLVAIVGTPTYVQSTSITLPTHAVGDLIIIWAARGSNTVATKPAAGGTVPTWTDILANTGSNATSLRSAYCVATATNHTSGTWTSAGCMCAVVLRGQNATPIGGKAETSATLVNTTTAPSITLTNSSGSSTILHMHMALGATWAAAPAGYTRQGTALAAGSVAPDLCLNTKNVTTTAPSVNQGTTASDDVRGMTIEVLD